MQSSFSNSFGALCLSLCLLANYRAYAQDSEANPGLTALETKWLNAGSPVLEYADEQHLPIDIIVQPQAGADDVPIAMGIEHGRCKLVFSLRGNAAAEATLATLPLELQATAIEAMTAHEVAHCWRFINGMWHTLPAGFVEAADTGSESKLATQRKAMIDTRREEGFADLVGLAWTLRTHPDQYMAIHHWFQQIRADQSLSGGFHNTRSWLQLAAQPQRFPSAITPFEQARLVWTEGLQLN